MAPKKSCNTIYVKAGKDINHFDKGHNNQCWKSYKFAIK